MAVDLPGMDGKVAALTQIKQHLARVTRHLSLSLFFSLHLTLYTYIYMYIYYTAYLLVCDNTDNGNATCAPELPATAGNGAAILVCKSS